MIEIAISTELRHTYSKKDGVSIVWTWCCGQFGDPGILGTKEGRWNTDTHTKFYFQNEKDAVLFSLKWSGK